MSTYQHAEAFALMTYVSDDGTVSTTVWNSRDGVTPFTIPGGPGLVLKHVDWRGDRYEPHWPHVGLAVGDLVFIDVGEKRARRGGHATDPRLGRFA